MKKNKAQDAEIQLPENDEGFLIDLDSKEDITAEEAELQTGDEQSVYFSEEEDEIINEGASDMSGAAKANIFKNKKFITIASVVAAVLIVIGTVFGVIASRWKKGDAVMPELFAKIGLFEGSGFRFFDGITVNDVDVSGLSVKKAKKKIEKELSNRSNKCNVTVKAEESTLELSDADFTYELDGDAGLKEAKTYCISVMHGKEQKQSKNFISPVKLTEQSIESIKAKAKVSLHKDPEDATLEGFKEGKVLFKDEVPGYDADEQDLISVISYFIAEGKSQGEVTVKTVSLPAKITKAQLEEKITHLSTFSTVSTNTPEATSNMRKALAACNNSVINPGETWSFNGCTGNSNIESAGWKKAVVYVGGKQDYGVGGGICQASTTIYNAALRANLAVVERRCHVWASGYVNPGFDATIDYPNIDLKLKNVTEYPVYLEAYMSGMKLVVNFYGYHEETYDEIKLNYYETSRVEGEYYTVSATRSWWLNGKLVKTENLPNSKYSLKPKTWASDDESSSSDVSTDESGDDSSTDDSSTDDGSGWGSIGGDSDSSSVDDSGSE